jgi:putative oxidoreductase
MFLHGVSKIHSGVGRIAEGVVAHGLPRAVAYGVYLGEFVAPLLVLLGLWTRPAALVIAFDMMVAVWLVHAGDLAHLGRTGGYALELQALYFIGAICIALLGAGRYSVSRGAGRFE